MPTRLPRTTNHCGAAPSHPYCRLMAIVCSNLRKSNAWSWSWALSAVHLVWPHSHAVKKKTATPSACAGFQSPTAQPWLGWETVGHAQGDGRLQKEPLAPGAPAGSSGQLGSYCCLAWSGIRPRHTYRVPITHCPLAGRPGGGAKLAKLAKLNNNASLAYPLRQWA
jgi:hypothetical protein